MKYLNILLVLVGTCAAFANDPAAPEEGQAAGQAAAAAIAQLHISPPAAAEPVQAAQNNQAARPMFRHRVGIGHSASVILTNWAEAHANHPYPTFQQKSHLMEQTGCSFDQISNWFTNYRKRFWQRH
jgi:hypothetical protein